MTSSLQFEPLIPWPLWLALVVCAVGVLVVYGLRRPWGISRGRWGAILTLAATALAVPLAVLLNPVWVERLPPPAGKPALTLLVDRSESMQTTDADGGQTRYAVAAKLAEATAAELDDNFDVQVITFADRAQRASLEGLEKLPPIGDQTDIARAIGSSSNPGSHAQHVTVLLSDGAHNAADDSASVFEAARLAGAMGTCIFTRTFGADTESKDLAVRLLVPEQVAFVRQQVPITVLVKQRGLPLPDVEIVLRRDGEDLGRVRANFVGDQPAEAHFAVAHDKTGLYRYEVAVEAVPGEIARANNQALMVVRVVDKPIRVLLLEGKPYWDGKFLLRTLALDAALEVDNVVRFSQQRLLKRSLRRVAADAAPAEGDQAAPDADPAGAPAVPAEEEAGAGDPIAPQTKLSESWEIISDPQEVLADKQALAGYQVVVLGREADVYLSDAALGNLRQWISHDGGALVCYRGQPTTQVPAQLRAMLPVEWKPGPESRFRIDLTERGQSLGWFGGDRGAKARLSDLPSLSSSTRIDTAKPLAVVLAGSIGPNQDDVRPAVLYQSFGAGRVVVIEGVGMWRWAFLPPPFRGHDDTYQGLWQSLLRWLVTGPRLLPGQDLAVRSDKLEFGPDEEATATMLVREGQWADGPPQVTLEGSGFEGKRSFQPVPLDDDRAAYQVNFGQLPEGDYIGAIEGVQGDEGSTRLAFEVRKLLDEQLYLQARPDIMGRIALLSDGAVLGEGDDVTAIAATIRQQTQADSAQEVRRQTAWDRWWVLLGAFGLWGILWTVRRTAGLV
jgi:hypothetical protein